MDQAASFKELCRLNNVKWKYDSVVHVVSLTRDGAKAQASIGSRIVIMDGHERIYLSQPIERVNNVIIVPPDFKKKVIDQLGKRKEVGMKRFERVIIDAGHGGKDPGAIGRDGLAEKIVVLDIAKGAKRYLEQRGVKVVMTRDKDEFISLRKRTELASLAKADLFLSIHANSYSSRGAHGMEVFYLRDWAWQKNPDNQLHRNIQIMSENLSMKKDSPILKDIISDMMYAHKQSESKKLASYTAGEMSKTIGARNRGSKSSGFYVLRNTFIPAILIEVGFLSNTREAKLLKKSSYRKRIAQAIAQSILNYGSNN